MKCCAITHSAKETQQQKRREGLHKVGGRNPLPNYGHSSSESLRPFATTNSEKLFNMIFQINLAEK